LEKVPFCESLFSTELNRQSVFKFAIDIDVLRIYRLIPRTPGFLGHIAKFWYHFNHSLFVRLILEFTDPLDIQMHVSWYKSIAKQCIGLPVKFEDGLSISVLRNKSFFPKH
jgi:hypothetical protein